MGELGVQLIFTLSPQAKGRVERTGGNLPGPADHGTQAGRSYHHGGGQGCLETVPPRFNRRFGVPPRWPEPAFRPSQPELSLSQVLCFKHRMRVARDNTVKFHKHTLQLLPSQQRRSYAGAVVVVLQGLEAGCRYSMRAASSHPSRRRPVRERSGPAIVTLRLTPSGLLAP